MKGSKPTSTFTQGSRVLATGKIGTVRFIGATEFAAGEWVGIELDDSNGKNDGSVAGVRYFQCATNHGLFVKGIQIKPYVEEAIPSLQSSQPAIEVLPVQNSSAPAKIVVAQPVVVTPPIVVSPLTSVAVSVPIEHAEAKQKDDGVVLDILSKLDQQYEIERVLREEIESLRQSDSKSNEDLSRMALKLSTAKSEYDKSTATQKYENNALTTRIRSMESDISLNLVKISELEQSIHRSSRDASEMKTMLAEKDKKIKQLEDVVSDQSVSIELLALDKEQLMIEKELLNDSIQASSIIQRAAVIANDDDHVDHGDDGKLREVIVILHTQLSYTSLVNQQLTESNSALSQQILLLCQYKSDVEEELTELRDLAETGRDFEVIIERLTHQNVDLTELTSNLKTTIIDLESTIEVSDGIEYCLRNEVSDHKKLICQLEIAVDEGGRKRMELSKTTMELNLTISGLRTRIINLENCLEEAKLIVSSSSSSSLPVVLLDASSVEVRRRLCMSAIHADDVTAYKFKCDVLSSLIPPSMDDDDGNAMITTTRTRIDLMGIHHAINRMRTMMKNEVIMMSGNDVNEVDRLFNVIIICIIKISLVTSAVSCTNFKPFIFIYPHLSSVVSSLHVKLKEIEFHLIDIGLIQPEDVTSLGSVVDHLVNNYVRFIFPIDSSSDDDDGDSFSASVNHLFASSSSSYSYIAWSFVLLLMCLNTKSSSSSLLSSLDDWLTGNKTLIDVDSNGKLMMMDESKVNGLKEACKLVSTGQLPPSSSLLSFFDSSSSSSSSSISVCQAYAAHIQAHISKGLSSIAGFKSLQLACSELNVQVESKSVEVESLKRQLISFDTITKRFFEMSKELSDYQDRLRVSETERTLLEEAYKSMEIKLSSSSGRQEEHDDESDLVGSKQLHKLLSLSLMESDCLRRQLIKSECRQLRPARDVDDVRREKAIIRAKISTLDNAVCQLNLSHASLMLPQLKACSSATDDCYQRQLDLTQSKYYFKQLLEAYSQGGN